MSLSKYLANARMCAAMLFVGCAHEAYPAEDAAFDDDEQEQRSWKDWQQLPLAASSGGGGGGDDDDGAEVIDVEILDVTLPKSLHEQGIALPAKLVRPVWSKPVGPRPAMLVLHGSGGLLKNPQKGEKGTCSAQMETQFTTWSERLAKLGYTVLLPSSYSARGFCDKHTDEDKMPSTFDDKPEQILGRIYDVDASARWLCERPEVDCERMGLLGFSQGATMVMVALHWQIEHAIEYFRDTKGDTVDIEVPDVKPGRPDFQVGIAYYPGCGFDGIVPTSTKASAAVENKFMATSPLLVLHADDDPLVEHCSVEFGVGSRETQSGQVAGDLKIPNSYAVTVYPDAGHSFDSAGSKAEGGTPEGNLAAREAALAATLEALDLHLMD